MDINSIVTNVKRVLAPFGIGKTQVPNNDIPYRKTTIENQMSWYDGIPTITTEPVREDGTGGIPPRAGDIAGLHNVWSTTQFNAQLGIMPNEYNSAYQDSEYFKGYPRGAVVLWPAGDSTTKNIYISLIDNNTYLPNNTQYWRQMIDGNAFANISLGNLNIEGKGLIKNIAFPAYSAREWRYAETNYTAATNGWIYFCGNRNEQDSYIIIDGIQFIIYAEHATGAAAGASLLPISKGSTYRISNATSIYEYWWLPCSVTY